MSDAGAPQTLLPRVVTCPTCAGPSLYAPENRFRPFCSAPCKRIDLGAWASGSYRVAFAALVVPAALALALLVWRALQVRREESRKGQ